MSVSFAKSLFKERLLKANLKLKCDFIFIKAKLTHLTFIHLFVQIFKRLLFSLVLYCLL